VAVVLSGIVVSKLLLVLGLGSMRTRYGVAVAVAYAVFFALVGLWLMYVRRAMFGARAGGSSSGGRGDFNVSLGSGGSSGGGSGSGIDLPRFSSGGGRFGGGGASGSFTGTDVTSQANLTASNVSGSGSGGSSGGKGSGSWGGFDLDLDDGIVIVIAFITFVCVVAVTAGWLLYDAPHMFGEAAFQCFLASGLFRGTRALKAGGWLDAAAGGWTAAVARRTVIPFLMVAVAAVVFGHIAQRMCPDARSLVEAFRFCVKG
jgi:hypothetical protein